MLRALASLVVPPACLTCGRPSSPGAALCRACHAEVPWLDPEALCPRCALPRPCGVPCPAAGAAFGRAWAPVAHEGSARALVHALKFHGLLGAARTMAAHAATIAPPDVLAADAIVPVPPDPARRRERGFDAAAELAKTLAGSPALARRGAPPVVRALRAPAALPRQLGASRAARLARRSARLPGVRGPVPKRVLLVDDVHTTGATLDACARALREAGAEWVTALTYARAIR